MTQTPRFRLASQYRTNFHALDTGSLNRSGEVFGNFLIDVDDDIAVIVFDLLERHAGPRCGRASGLDDLAGFHDALHVDAVDRAGNRTR